MGLKEFGGRQENSSHTSSIGDTTYLVNLAATFEAHPNFSIEL